MAFFFVPRMVRHEGSKALRNTKDWCGGFAMNARMWEWFFVENGSPRRLEGTKKHEGLVRKFCHECTNVEWFFVENCSPRRLEGAKKHEGLVRRFCHECTNVGMILVLKTLQHLIYQLHIHLYSSNNHLLIYLLH